MLCAIAAFVYLPSKVSDLTNSTLVGRLDASRTRTRGSSPRSPCCSGIVLASIILWLTGHFTGTDKKPTQDVAKTSLTGAATVVLSGIGVGLESAVYTAVIIAAAVYGAFLLGGSTVTLSLFLIALAGCGLLTTVGVIVAMDTFGPVSDNAQGIAEMSGDVDEEGAKILTELDAVGNTTKAITKGIAIATAVLAATALFGSYQDAVSEALTEGAGVSSAPAYQPGVVARFDYQIITPSVLVGLLARRGRRVPVLRPGHQRGHPGGRRHRLRGAAPVPRHPGIMEGTERPEYGKVVDICTRDSLRELATPGLLAALAPVAVGFGLGIGPLAGYLAGAIGTGTLMAVFLANSGGAWDNAKKIVEDGNHGGKGSAAHEATVIGDTVGDPFKDTAGPAINPLIKVMNLVSVLIAPAIVSLTVGEHANSAIRYGIAARRGRSSSSRRSPSPSRGRSRSATTTAQHSGDGLESQPTPDIELHRVARSLAGDLATRGFRVGPVGELLGPVALGGAGPRRGAAGRPGHARPLVDEPLAVLTRLWLLGLPVARSALDRALPTAGTAGAEALGLVEASGEAGDDEVRPLLELSPYAADDAEWWLASDLTHTGRPLRRDHVLGRRRRVDDPGPVDAPRPGRHGPRHRHRLRGPGLPPGHPRRVGHRDGHVPALPAGHPAQRPAQRGGRGRAVRRPQPRPARRQPARAGRRAAVRPRRLQPAVRHHAPRGRRSGRRLHLPRRRAGRRRHRPPAGRPGSVRCWPRAARPSCSATGSTAGARPGPSGSGTGWRRAGCTAGSSSARCRTRRSTPRPGPATAGTSPGSAEHDAMYAAWLADFAARGSRRSASG